MSLSYLLKRLGHILLTMFVVSIAVFSITQVLPGNAAVMILGEFATPDAITALEQQLGLDRSLPVQFASWLGNFLTGDWGTSMSMLRPVRPLILKSLGHSLLLAIPTLVLVSIIAIPLGVMAAVRRGKTSDLIISIVSYLGVSMPEFVTGTLLLVLLARPRLGWFPAGGLSRSAPVYGRH